MGDENKTQYELDLDGEQFIETGKKIVELLQNIDEQSFGNIIGSLTSLAAPLVAISVVAVAVKSKIDQVFEAEAIEKYNNQFKTLASNFGLVGDILKDQLIGEAQGLVTELDLVKEGSKGIVELGTNAGKLPAIMGLARQATNVFGGTLIDNFENMSRAIASGNQKMLAHLGLHVDVTKAVRDYADANGIAESAISAVGRQTALLNAVLEKGKTAFEGLEPKQKTATDLWTQLKNTVTDTMEVITVYSGKKTQPALVSLLETLKSGAEGWKFYFKSMLGSGPEQATASLDLLKYNLTGLQKQLDALQKQEEYFNAHGVKDGALASAQAIQTVKAEIATYQAKIDQATGAVKKFHDEEGKAAGAKTSAPGAAAAGGDSGEDLVKAKELRAKFEGEVGKLREERVKKEIALSQSALVDDILIEERRLQQHKQVEAKIEEVDASHDLTSSQKIKMKGELRKEIADKDLALEEERVTKKIILSKKEMEAADELDKFDELLAQHKILLAQEDDVRKKAIMQNELLSDQQKKNALLQNEKLYSDKVKQLKYDTYAAESKVIDNSVKHADTAAKKFGAGFAANSAKAKLALNDFGAQGAKMSSILSSHMSDAFIQMGEGGKKGSDILKGAVFGMISDVCIEYGSMLLLTSIWPPNPLGLAAGAALLVLGGAAKSMAGSSGGGVSAGGGLGGGGSSDAGLSAGSTAAAASSATDSVAANAQQAKSVHLEVHGSIFDSNETATRITDLVKTSLDSTDFSVRKIGSA